MSDLLPIGGAASVPQVGIDQAAGLLQLGITGFVLWHVLAPSGWLATRREVTDGNKQRDRALDIAEAFANAKDRQRLGPTQ